MLVPAGTPARGWQEVWSMAFFLPWSRARMTGRSGLLAVVAAAAVVRIAALAFIPGALATDPDGYRQLAENVMQHATFGFGDVPTAYRPPLYPLLLVPCLVFGPHARTAIAGLHVALGVATVWLTDRLGRRWGLGNYSLAAAALVACDPILLHQSTLVMTETLAALLAVVGLNVLSAAADRPSGLRWATAGACLGLAVLCRPTFLLFSLLAALALPWFAATAAQRLKGFLAFVAAFAVVLAPWALRNQVYFGRPIVATTHGGYTLLLGNNPGFYEYLRTGKQGSLWDATQFNRDWAGRAPRSGPAAELANDRRAYAEARQWIAREPRLFVYACLVRIGRLWQILPHQTNPNEAASRRGLRYLVGLWYSVELPLALMGVMWLLGRRVAPEQKSVPRPTNATGWPGDLADAVARRPALTLTLPRRGWRLKTWLWGVLLAGSFMAVHAVYWTNMRMRAPLMPAVALAAVVAAVELAERFSRRS